MSDNDWPDGTSGAAIVRVRLFGELVRFSGGRGYAFDWPLAPGATVADILAAIGIPAGEVWLVSVNGVKADLGATPGPDDELMVFSPVGGG